MPLPVPANTICDIYRNNAASPSAVGVPCYLAADYERRMETGESMGSGYRYTHVLLVDVAVDVRDSFSLYTPGGASQLPDQVYVPNKATGTKFQVTFVERHNRGNPSFDHKRVFLDRGAPTWPTNNL
jgi:hypothetical protein